MGLSTLKQWVISNVALCEEQVEVGQQGQGDRREVMAGTERAKRVTPLMSLGLLSSLGLLPSGLLLSLGLLT